MMRKIVFQALIAVMLLSSCKNNEDRKSVYEFNKVGPLVAPPTSINRDNPTIGAYYTTVVNMDSIPGFPYKYAMYFSTDHARDKGGIWLYLCNGNPTEIANWISYDEALSQGKFDYIFEKPTRNPIYIDTISGFQTETPHANIIEGKVFMSYHNILNDKMGQATMMANSSDGINFTRICVGERGIILPIKKFLNHTGYFRWGKNPFSKVYYKYIGYSLRKGTIDYRSAMWGSNDCLQWFELHRINGWNTGKALPENDRYIIWHEIDPNSIKKINENEYVVLTAGGSRAAGAMNRITELYEFYLASDGITQTRMARKVLTVGNSTSYDAEECSSPVTIECRDSIYLIYVGTAHNGYINTVMGATGTFSKKVQLPNELADEEKQYHIYSNVDYVTELKKYEEQAINSTLRRK
jgi:hypothetical protein